MCSSSFWSACWRWPDFKTKKRNERRTVGCKPSQNESIPPGPFSPSVPLLTFRSLIFANRSFSIIDARALDSHSCPHCSAAPRRHRANLRASGKRLNVSRQKLQKEKEEGRHESQTGRNRDRKQTATILSLFVPHTKLNTPLPIVQHRVEAVEPELVVLLPLLPAPGRAVHPHESRHLLRPSVEHLLSVSLSLEDLRSDAAEVGVLECFAFGLHTFEVHVRQVHLGQQLPRHADTGGMCCLKCAEPLSQRMALVAEQQGGVGRAAWQISVRRWRNVAATWGGALEASNNAAERGPIRIFKTSKTTPSLFSRQHNGAQSTFKKGKTTTKNSPPCTR